MGADYTMGRAGLVHLTSASFPVAHGDHQFGCERLGYLASGMGCVTYSGELAKQITKRKYDLHHDLGAVGTSGSKETARNTPDRDTYVCSEGLAQTPLAPLSL